jgi:hypothetical protein
VRPHEEATWLTEGAAVNLEYATLLLQLAIQFIDTHDMTGRGLKSVVRKELS